jgi:hypothetical protein
MAEFLKNKLISIMEDWRVDIISLSDEYDEMKGKREGLWRETKR